MKKQKILTCLRDSGQAGLPFDRIAERTSVRKYEVNAILDELIAEGQVIDVRGRYYLAAAFPFVTATVVKLAGNFGFVRPEEGEADLFIPGSYLRGAMPGDRCLVMPLPDDGQGPAGRVVRVTEQGPGEFVGIYTAAGGGSVALDPAGRLQLRATGKQRAEEGDKVLCRVVQRGESHRDHRVQIVKSYGSSRFSGASVEALLEAEGIAREFPADTAAEAAAIGAAGISAEQLRGRCDLRDEPIFTIDGPDTKDIDDAVSVAETESGFALGVHIADVSEYVRPGTALDREAYDRGTSIYFGQSVIPMLPPELSNGICSLNPGEDRLAFSALMTFDKAGAMTGFEFRKTVIRSRVKGVYGEISALLAGDKSPELLAKYAEVLPGFPAMQALFRLLERRKIARGAPEIETEEAKFKFDADGRVVDISRRERHESEKIIEEFMLSANEAAAKFAGQYDLPFVYRVHEKPDDLRVDSLREIVAAFGLPAKDLRPGLPPLALAQVLKHAKGKPCEKAVNMLVLRTMQKAVYSDIPLGHYGLALSDYAHFTSPIRRYPDLTIHRIMSELLRGVPLPEVQKKFGAFAAAAARQSSETEQRAVGIERSCADIYKAEYMVGREGEEFLGTIGSIAPHGLYVELDNTVEGLVRLSEDSLKKGVTQVRFDSRTFGRIVAVGDRVRVKLLSCNVAAGQIDFEITAWVR